MTTDQPPLNVLGICGSLRADSWNRKLLESADAIAGDRMDVTIVDVDLPLFDEDVERDGDPPAVVAFKEAIAAADALLIATPEYQHGIPGPLKNALDWASRPAGESPLDGKVAAVLGATPGDGGTVRAQVQLRQTLEFTNTYTVLQPEVLVANAPDRFGADGSLTDDDTIGFVDQLIDELVALAARERLAGAATR